MEDSRQDFWKRRGRRPWPTWAVVGLCFAVVASVASFFFIRVHDASARSANEAAAIRTLQTVAAAQRDFRAGHGAFGTFDELIASGALDKRFSGESPVVYGYVFRVEIKPRAGASPEAFTLNADPLRDDGAHATGKHHFYVSSSDGEIRHAAGRPAGPSDLVVPAR